MTNKEFYKRLRKLRNGWRIRPSGHIRCSRGDCPITAVANDMIENGYFLPSDFKEAAQEIGLRPDIALSIIAAADTLEPISKAAITHRARIIKALAL